MTDSPSGMRVFKRSILAKIFPLPNGLNLTPVMSTRAVHEDLKIIEIPIPYSERLGRSKLSVVHDGKLFLESMIWTAMSYNPVRIFGMLGLAGVLLSALVLIGLVISRIGGTTQLGPWAIAAVFSALVNGVVGISLFTLGVTFNYVVSLFYNTPIRQGLFGKPLLKKPLEMRFGWMGLVVFLVGSALAITTLVLGITGWDMNRLWLYLLGSAMLVLVGVQLMINWFLVRVLSELRHRDLNAARDLNPIL